MSMMSGIATDLEINWRRVDGEYHHLDHKWRIVPAWTGQGVELFERVDAPLNWSVLLAFDRLEHAVHYVMQLSKA